MFVDTFICLGQNFPEVSVSDMTDMVFNKGRRGLWKSNFFFKK